MAQEDVLPVGVGCRLCDAIRDADKSENNRDIRREERDQRAEVGKQVLGKHTRAAAFNATMEACFGTGFDPVDYDARGRISLKCSRKVADALCKGILVGGQSVRAESEEPSDDEDVPCRPKGGAKEMRGSAERGHEGKGKGKGFGRGLRCYGCASTHPWSRCRLVKYESRKELCGKCGEQGHLQELCEVTRASCEWYVAEYGRPWEWRVNLVPNVEEERRRPREHSGSPKRRHRSKSRSRSPRSGRSRSPRSPRSPRSDSRGRRRSRDGGRGRDREGGIAWGRRCAQGDRDRDYDREYERDCPRGWEQAQGGHPDTSCPMALPWHWGWSPQPTAPSPDAGQRVPSPWDGHPSGTTWTGGRVLPAPGGKARRRPSSSRSNKVRADHGKTALTVGLVIFHFSFSFSMSCKSADTGFLPTSSGGLLGEGLGGWAGGMG